MLSVIVISGPTASGKTKLAIELCKRIPGEVVSADSVQVFRGFNIGAAKPSLQEMEGVRHHLIDILDATETMDADRFRKLADESILDIAGRGLTPFVVGGTGFYIKSLLYGLMKAPLADLDIRRKIEEEASTKGWRQMHSQLAALDPPAAAKISINDRQRIQRALEYIRITGNPISKAQYEHGFKMPRYRYLHLALNPAREILYAAINNRVDEMISKGLVEEVNSLLASGIPEDCAPMKSHGYKHSLALIKNEIDAQEFIRQLKRDHRRYAKRQMTWLRNQPNVQYLDFPPDMVQIESIVKNFLPK